MRSGIYRPVRSPRFWQRARTVASLAKTSTEYILAKKRKTRFRPDGPYGVRFRVARFSFYVFEEGRNREAEAGAGEEHSDDEDGGSRDESDENDDDVCIDNDGEVAANFGQF
jgi:hypothetical protein